MSMIVPSGLVGTPRVKLLIPPACDLRHKPENGVLIAVEEFKKIAPGRKFPVGVKFVRVGATAR